MGALSGIRVLDISRLLPGPYCSMVLADHGADVIAIEDRKFEAEGPFITAINRNKKHMSLNLKSEEGKKIFFRLVKDADILLEGFRPGVVKKLGVDYDTVRRINPRIIYCSITGYGQTGSFRDKVGHDVNYISYAGVLNLIGEADRAPVIPGIPVADVASGALNAVVGVLLALYARERNGRGQYIDISMTDGLLSFLTIALFLRELTGREPQRGDMLISHRYACCNIYETADGRYISLGAMEKRFWMPLCEHLGMPEYGVLQYNENRRKEIISVMRETFRKKTLAEWEKELEGLEVCWAPVWNLEEVLKGPLFREREMVVEVMKKDGTKITAMGIPVKLSETPGSIRTPPVGFGENTLEILQGLGYSKEEVKELADKGVI